jgi:hypothetical protein
MDNPFPLNLPPSDERFNVLYYIFSPSQAVQYRGTYRTTSVDPDSVRFGTICPDPVPDPHLEKNTRCTKLPQESLAAAHLCDFFFN